MKRWLVVLLLVGLTVLSPSALAEEDVQSSRKFMVCHATGIATAKEAQPYINEFGKYLADKLGWSEGSHLARFEDSRAGALKALEEWKPAYASLALGLYLEAGDKFNLKPLVMAKVNGKTTNVYRVVVKKGTVKSLDELKGKVLTGNLVDDSAFLSRIVFQGKLSAGDHFELKQTNRALRAIRKVARGKADSALVDDIQFKSLKQLPLYSKLEIIYESKPIPNLGLVYVEGTARADEIKRFAEALVGMCGDSQGKEICETFNVEGFEHAEPGVLDDAKALYTSGGK